MQYRVDAKNRIVELCPEWDRFAIANEGARAVAGEVLGRHLFDFVTGDPTRLFLHAVLDGARVLGCPRVLPYRCDSPTERRWFEMEVQPLPDGGVLVLHRLTDSRPRLASRTSSGKRWRCSQCLASRALGSQAWSQDDLSGRDVVGYDVCPQCTRRLFDGPAIQPTAGGLHGR